MISHHIQTVVKLCCIYLFIFQKNLYFDSLATEESYLRQLEIEEMYGAKKDDDKKSKEK